MFITLSVVVVLCAFWKPCAAGFESCVKDGSSKASIRVR